MRVLVRQLAVSILILSSLYHAATLVRDSIRKYFHAATVDPITALEERFDPLKARISIAEYRRVGYITNMPEDMDWATEYLRIQYALAPTIVSDSSNASLIVVNLKEPSLIEGISDADLLTVADYGNGVLLVSRRTR